LILGGGFAGLSAARAFERHLRQDRRITVTLLCRNNYLLFTPMLAEVAAGEIDSDHIATPNRSFLRGVHVQQGEVVAIELERHRVQLFSPVVQDQKELLYNHLILALGSVTTFRHAPGAAEHAFPFKHLGDAQRIHDRVLDCFDWAAGGSDPAQRRALLTFVVAGGASLAWSLLLHWRISCTMPIASTLGWRTSLPGCCSRTTGLASRRSCQSPRRPAPTNGSSSKASMSARALRSPG
jgi:NADH:ubiquinone reductase (H+-translocating)